MIGGAGAPIQDQGSNSSGLKDCSHTCTRFPWSLRCIKYLCHVMDSCHSSTCASQVLLPLNYSYLSSSCAFVSQVLVPCKYLCLSRTSASQVQVPLKYMCLKYFCLSSTCAPLPEILVNDISMCHLHVPA